MTGLWYRVGAAMAATIDEKLGRARDSKSDHWPRAPTAFFDAYLAVRRGSPGQRVDLSAVSWYTDKQGQRQSAQVKADVRRHAASRPSQLAKTASTTLGWMIRGLVIALLILNT